MKNILLILVKYGTHLLFIVLQIICFSLIVSTNESHKEIYDYNKSLLFGNLNNRVDQMADYMSLDDDNDSLAMANAKLMDIIINQKAVVPEMDADTLLQKQYDFIPTEICSKTLNLRNNYFMLCGGTLQGIEPNMGVISEQGIVGIVMKTSEHYAQVIPIIHSQSKISAAIKKNSFFGSLVWRESDPRSMKLEAIPKHAPISVGDTIVTSGYSSVFPKGVPIGVIKSFVVEQGSNNYDVDVSLFNDMHNLAYAYVVRNRLSEEFNTLQSETDE